MVSGFTIVRNASKLDYPFPECVLSILPLCDEFIINCGDSSDNTWDECEQLKQEFPDKIRLIRSVWQRENQKGGYQLKAQTDAALAECRGQWCLYIQADEAMHEADYPRIREAMARADKMNDVDGILFDYVHFYGNFSYRIQGRNWYRREVRAIKNHRGIHSFRDAQGFRKNEEKLLVIPSRARVFHYGYVRSSVSLGTKSAERSQWWGEVPVTDPSQLELVRHVGLKKFRESHPAVM
jgi:glycosyltransferase involved in cell wall biosynthesis